MGGWAYFALVPLLAAADSPAPRRVWAAANLLGAPSPDGRYLSYVDSQTGDLGVRELATGASRRLTSNPAGSAEFAYFSVFSRDSRSVAYAWFNQERFYDLRIAPLDGGAPRVLFRNEEAGFVQPTAFSPDGRHILTMLFRKDNTSQIALIPAGGGPPRVLKSLSWVYPRKMDFSPDGRFLVFDESGREDSPISSLYVMSLEDNRETLLVGEPGNNVFPVWAPDGGRVLFASDRGGRWGLWSVAVKNGRPGVAPVCLRPDAGRLLPLGVTRQGTYYYGLRSGSTAVHLARLDLASGRLLEEPAALRPPFAGDTRAPEWSPDGRRLAMLIRVGAENFGLESRAVALWLPETNEWRLVSPKLAWLERLRWSPDGRSLLVSGSDRSARRGLFQVDPESGDTTPLVRETASTYRGLEGVWAGDLFHLRDATLLRRDEPVFTAPPPARLRELTVSPDGRWLAFVSTSEKDALLAIPVEGGEPRQLASVEPDGISALDWTPDSGSLLVSTPTRPTPGLWRVSLEGGKPERLPVALDRQGGLRLHPDGRRAAFTRGSIQPEVWVLDLPPR